MKFVIPKLRLGEIVEARVADSNRDGSLIVDFDGDLLRVLNQAKLQFRVGQKVRLEVRAVNPLQFRVQSPSQNKYSSIDRNA